MGPIHMTGISVQRGKFRQRNTRIPCEDWSSAATTKGSYQEPGEAWHKSFPRRPRVKPFADSPFQILEPLELQESTVRLFQSLVGGALLGVVLPHSETGSPRKPS